MALLSVPLAFTFRDAQDGDGQLATEPLSLLESARRYAGRIVVFSQGGYTGVPRADQPALAFIEESVIAAFPPARSELGAIFHPKVWVLRYVPRDDTDDHPVRYRLVNQSRNLTFDSSWDVSLVLDGELNENRVNAYSINHPLADFRRGVAVTGSRDPSPASSRRAHLYCQMSCVVCNGTLPRDSSSAGSCPSVCAVPIPRIPTSNAAGCW